MHGNIINLVGQRFGRLVVLEFSHTKKGEGAYWLCVCDCGNKKIISGSSMKKSHTLSCGCKARENFRNLGLSKRKNIIGNKYGRLLVIEFSHIDQKRKAAFWVCECDCGNIIIVNGTKLRNNHTKSCGCLQKEFARNTFFIDISEQTFGYFFVNEFDSFGKRGSKWKCTCKCGNQRIVYATDLKEGHVVSCGCKRRKTLKNYENSNKGFTERELLRNSIEYIEWRKSVFEIGKYTCVKCGQIGDYLEAHHIFSFDKNLEIRFNTENGIVFCKQCHVDFHKKYGFGNNTKSQLIEFLKII